MEQMTEALIASIPVLVGVLTTGFVGAGLAFLWNFQLKQRELDLTAAQRFQDLYGEFFAVWKLWNYYIRDIGPEAFPDASRWKLLERACAAEAGMEATFIELASKRNLSPSAIEDLGQFRQVYQQLRESIRDNVPIEWDWSEHDAYKAFKELAPRVAQMIRTGRGTGGKRAEQRVEAWLEVTSNRFEDFWLERRGA
jgi:hypothetical protein